MSQTDPVAPQPTNAPARSGRRWWLLGLLVAAALAAGGAGYYAWHRILARPAIPSVDLEGADPEIATVIRNARRDVVGNPRSAEAWGELAMVLHAHGYYTEAIRAYEVASTLEPKNATWPYLQGLALHEGVADAQGSLAPLRKAAELSRRLPARARLGEALLELGRLQEAEAEFRQVLAAAPGDARAQLGQAQAAENRRDYKTALGYLEALRDSPHARHRACAKRAALQALLGDKDAARREQRLLAELPPDPPWPDEALERIQARQAGLDTRLNRAAELANEGRLGDALFLLDSTVERYPTSDRAWKYLGEVLINARDNRRAEQALRKCVELAPDKAENWLTLGGFYQNGGRSEEAERAFRKAVALTPASVPAHLGLGDSLRDQGDRKGAAAAYRQAVKLRPDRPEARQRLQRLTEQP
jgi:tetratricopeptide (TPR) repeat protein